MTAPMKLEKSVTSPIGRLFDLVEEPVAQPRPHRPRNVGAGGGRALLPLELERPADQRGAQHVDVGGRVRDDEVLAAGLAHQPRVGPVARQVLRRPCATGARTSRVEPVKWMPARSGCDERDLADRASVAR